MRYFAIFVFLLMSVQLYAATSVQMSVGSVRLLPLGSSSWRDLRSGDAVKTGDTIQTGTGSFAEISADGSIIRVQPKTTVKLGQNLVQGKPEGFLSLFIGSVSCKMQKLRKSGSGYRVSTPSSVCAIRGTQFDVAASADGGTVLQVTEGAVSFEGLSDSVLVSANQESSAAIGKNPEPVRILKKKNWKEWADSASSSVKGKEREIIDGCLQKMKKLDADILQLENEKTDLDAASANLFAESKKARDAGNAKEADRIAGEAERKHTAASSMLSMAFYQASRIELVMSVAANAYDSADDKKTIKKPFEEIRSIHSSRFGKYIKPILDSAAKRQEILDRRKK